MYVHMYVCMSHLSSPEENKYEACGHDTVLNTCVYLHMYVYAYICLTSLVPKAGILYIMSSQRCLRAWLSLTHLMYAYIYIYMYIYIYISDISCPQAGILITISSQHCLRAWFRMWECSPACKSYIHTQIHTYIHTYTNAYWYRMWESSKACKSYIHTYTHTYIHTYILIQDVARLKSL
jgi:hypothetical protein